MQVKNLIKELLLKAGLYYKISDRYRENAQRFHQQKKFYSQFIKKDDLVFDVGANIGQRSFVFSKLCSKIIAIEPQPFCQRHLRSRFLYSSKVIVVPCAIDVKEGIANFYQATNHTVSSMSEKFISKVSSSIFKDVSWNQTIEVKTIPLDKLISQYGLPAFLKIDVEGYELNVLKSLSKPVKAISFEFTPSLIEETEKCVNRLCEISGLYRFNFSLGEELNLQLQRNESQQDFRNTLSALAKAGSFGDVYAILS